MLKLAAMPSMKLFVLFLDLHLRKYSPFSIPFFVLYPLMIA